MLFDFLTSLNTSVSGSLSSRGGRSDNAISLSGTANSLLVFRWVMQMVFTPCISWIFPHLRCCISPKRIPVIEDKPKASCTIRSFSVAVFTARKALNSSGVRYSRCLSGAWNRSPLANVWTGLKAIKSSLNALLNIALMVCSKSRSVKSAGLPPLSFIWLGFRYSSLI